MPRLYHRPPKYCLHKGTKQATVSIGGKRIYLGPYGSPQSHRKYQEILERWNQERDAQRSAPQPSTSDPVASVTASTLRKKRLDGSPITINELVLVYRRHTHQYYRKNDQVTREAYIIDEAIRTLRKHHATTFLADFGPVALDELRNKMIGDLDWSRKYINKQVSRLVRMFVWAAEKELVEPSVPMALKALAGLKKGRSAARESAGVTCVDDAVVDATLQILPEMIADMVRFQRLTGARPGEVCSLRPCDLDKSADVWIYRPSAHKTEHHEKDRLIAIGPKAQRLLGRYLACKVDSFCFSPAESERMRRDNIALTRKTPLSCGNRRGTNRKSKPKRMPKDHYTTDSYRRAIHRACERLKQEKWSPNQLRHTSATEIRKRFGIEAAQVVCGHENANVTQIYAERDLDLAKQVAREVG